MNHPTPEEWVPYVCGEVARQTRKSLKQHLKDCSECRTRVAEWRLTLRSLDHWQLPRPAASAPAPVFTFGLLKWAAAAVFLLLAGFAVGRVLQPGADAAQIRAAIQPDIRKALMQEVTAIAQAEAERAAASTVRAAGQEADRVAAAYVRALQTQNAADRQALQATLDTMETQRVTDLAALKRQLDTLALNTDASLRHTVEGLVELATYRTTANHESSTQ